MYIKRDALTVFHFSEIHTVDRLASKGFSSVSYSRV